MNYLKLLLVALLAIVAISMVEAEAGRELRRRKSSKSKSSKSKSGKKSKKNKSSKGSKSSKSKGSKSSKKKGNKKDKSCKSSKSGKSAKKCDDRFGDTTEIVVTIELAPLLLRRKLQTSNADIEAGVGDCLTPPDATIPFIVECSGGPEIFICEADLIGVPIDEAADIAADLLASFNDGSLENCITTELPGFGVESFGVEVDTEAPTATPTEAPVEPTEAPVDPTEAPVAPVAPSVPTLAPSASAYPTAADPVPGPGDDD